MIDPVMAYMLIMGQAHQYQRAVERRCIPCAHIWYDVTIHNFHWFITMCIPEELREHSS